MSGRTRAIRDVVGHIPTGEPCPYCGDGRLFAVSMTAAEEARWCGDTTSATGLYECHKCASHVLSTQARRSGR